MHVVAAMVALAALVLYADRSGWLFGQGAQSRSALLTRLGLGGVLASIVVAFVDLALESAAFEWRHWLVLLPLALTVVGHFGLRRGGPSDPT